MEQELGVPLHSGVLCLPCLVPTLLLRRWTQINCAMLPDAAYSLELFVVRLFLRANQRWSSVYLVCYFMHFYIKCPFCFIVTLNNLLRVRRGAGFTTN